MTEYELDRICQSIDCDCKCERCPFFAETVTEENERGYYVEDEDCNEDEIW